MKPMGDDGTYFQTVKNRGYRVTRNSSVTVEVNGESRTFKHGDHVTFADQRRRQADADVRQRRVRRLRHRRAAERDAATSTTTTSAAGT